MGRLRSASSAALERRNRKSEQQSTSKESILDLEEDKNNKDVTKSGSKTTIDIHKRLKQQHPTSKTSTKSRRVVDEKSGSPDLPSSKSQQQNGAEAAEEAARPKRRATNSHFFRYLQTNNPTRLEEEDLRRALEASLEECPDYWPEDTASCSSSDQSNAPSSSAGSSAGGGSGRGVSCCYSSTGRLKNNCKLHGRNHRKNSSTSGCCCSRSHQQTCAQSTMHSHNNSSNHNHHHCNQHCHSGNSDNHNHNQHPATNCHMHNCSLSAGAQCCPVSSVHRRYKPVAKKNIYYEADFFHDGILEYIEYELIQADAERHDSLRRHYEV